MVIRTRIPLLASKCWCNCHCNKLDKSCIYLKRSQFSSLIIKHKTNHCYPIIDDMSGALIILRIEYSLNSLWRRRQRCHEYLGYSGLILTCPPDADIAPLGWAFASKRSSTDRFNSSIFKTWHETNWSFVSNALAHFSVTFFVNSSVKAFLQVITY